MIIDISWDEMVAFIQALLVSVYAFLVSHWVEIMGMVQRIVEYVGKVCGGWV